LGRLHYIGGRQSLSRKMTTWALHPWTLSFLPSFLKSFLCVCCRVSHLLHVMLDFVNSFISLWWVFVQLAFHVTVVILCVCDGCLCS
jgi:hypothetical protein